MFTKEQEDAIDFYMQEFKKYSKTNEFEEDMIDRENRSYFFSKLSLEVMESMDEFLFGEIVSNLWASQIWTNKDYLIKKIISQNSLEKLRSQLFNLIFGIATLPERYNEFSNNIKSLGPSSTTEILCMFKPDENGIWNDKARKALKILGFESILPINKYKINGEEYVKFNSVLRSIAIKLEKEFKDQKIDLLFVDYFLYYTWSKGHITKSEPINLGVIKPEEIKERNKFIFDHDEIKEHIRDIGEALGFESEVERKIANGSVVDVVWKAKIANLGVVTYVFEVQTRGSTDSLILNLQKAKNNQSVQKLIAVSDSEQLEKIKKEVNEIPGDMKKSFSFWDARDVESTFEKLTEVVKSIEKLDLVKDQFDIEK